MTHEQIQSKLVDLTLKGIKLSQTRSPFGAVLTGEREVGGRVVATSKLIENTTMANVMNPHLPILNALIHIEATLMGIES